MLDDIDKHFLFCGLFKAFDDDAWGRLDVDAALRVETVVDFTLEGFVLVAGEGLRFVGDAAQLLFY